MHLPADKLISPTTGTDTNDSYLLVHGCTLLAPQERGGLLPAQDILIVGSRIQAVGPTGTITLDTSRNCIVLEGEGRLAIPGLINAHTHSPENVLKATSPSLPLELWLVPLFAGIVEWTPRLAYLSALLGACEMLKTGTTAVLDHLWTVEGVTSKYLDAVMQAYQDVGIRASVAPHIEDIDLVLDAGAKRGLVFPHHPFIDRFAAWPPIAQQLVALEQFISTWHDASDGRLRTLVGPSGIHWCSPSLLSACLVLAERYKTGLHLHAVETELQAHVIQEAFGQSGISFLNAAGVLQRGTSLAHAIWLEPGDLERLAQTETTVVHNPISNLRLGSGVFPLIEAQRLGVTIALGSDGAASNDTQNMFGVLKQVGLMHNHPNKDYKQWPNAEGILTAATKGGATALGLEAQLGEIAPGYLADIVLLNLEAHPFFPLHDPSLHLVYCENGESVESVIVHGNIVVDHRRLTTVDERALRDELRVQCATAWPGFPESLASVAHTQEVLTTFDTLRRLLLKQEVGFT